MANFDTSSAGPPLTPGSRLRVAPSAADGVARRALLLSEEDDERYEVEFEGGANEEAVVPCDKCTPLLLFELAADAGEASAVASAERYKAQGNVLFKLRDAAAAIEMYVAGLKMLASDSRGQLCEGARALIRGPAGSPAAALRGALVLVVDSATADVEFEPDPPAVARASGVAQGLADLLKQAEAMQKGEPAADPAAEPAPPADNSWRAWLTGGGRAAAAEAEAEPAPAAADAGSEDGVPRARIALVVHGTQPSLQCALLLNAAKCSLMLGEWGAALARAARAERVAAHDETEPAKTAALRRTALVVCARAALGMQRFGLATSHAAQLLAVPPRTEAAARAAALKECRTVLRDIQRRSIEARRRDLRPRFSPRCMFGSWMAPPPPLAQVQRSNRRLAKEMGSWVQGAMASNEGCQAMLLEDQ